MAAYKQLVGIDTTVTDKAGYCLRFARRVSNPDAPAGPNFAWDSWVMTKYKHADGNLPNVAVPVYFEYVVNGQNQGHVAWWIPAQNRFLSSPTSGTGQRWLDRLSQIEDLYHCRFVGWAEDINGVRVAEPLPELAPTPGMPAVGSRIQLVPPVTRTTFRAGTTTVAGHITATNDQFVYIVRGYDPAYPGRIIINSASGGGDGVALALYYTDGKTVENWKAV